MSDPLRRASTPREEAPRRWLTIPNGLCFLRLAGAPLLVFLAAADQRLAVVVVFVAMAISDWLDGKIAVLLDQRSAYGARLDSAADVAMYVAIALAALILDVQRLSLELPWIGAATLSYLAAGLFGLLKLGRWPTYHTRIAKTSWLLVLVGVVVFLGDLLAGDLSAWLLRLALALVTMGNLQSIAITSILPAWRTDVISIRAARALRRRLSAS